VTRVRRATLDDARAIAEVHVDTWRVAYPGVIPQDVLDRLDVDEREQRWLSWIPVEEIAVFVAQQDGRVVGFVSLGPSRDVDGTGELYAIYVAPGSWGTGAGPALMDEATEWLLARWDEAVLWVAEENPRARRFYERYGWIAEERRVEEVAPGAYVPEVRYRLSGLDRR